MFFLFSSGVKLHSAVIFFPTKQEKVYQAKDFCILFLATAKKKIESVQLKMFGDAALKFTLGIKVSNRKTSYTLHFTLCNSLNGSDQLKSQ